jgi:Rod binding domain-containing protein
MKIVPLNPDVLPNSANSTSPVAPSTATKTQNGSSKAEQVAADFEALFMDMMLKSMRKTAAGPDQSNAMDIYTGMLDSEYAKNMATTRNFGIKSMILDWLQRHGHNQKPELNMQGATQQPSTSAPIQAPIQLPTKADRLDELKARMATDVYALQARMLKP